MGQRYQVLSQFGVNEIMKKWANGLPLTDKRISPINGTIEGLPPVYMFGGGREMTHPDMKLFEQMMLQHHQEVRWFMIILRWYMIFQFIQLDNHIKLLNKLPNR